MQPLKQIKSAQLCSRVLSPFSDTHPWNKDQQEKKKRSKPQPLPTTHQPQGRPRWVL